jgi:hypothetical protein
VPNKGNTMAPKKAAKKAAKKAPGNHDPHKAGRDARRTFEHLGRVQALASLATGEQASIQLLVSTADAAYRSHQYKESADLLRAAEHLAFAAIVETDRTLIAKTLLEAIQEECDHLLERAEEHGAAEYAPAAIRKLCGRMTKDAASAMRRKAYRAALELARGAEALAHVENLDEKLLGAGELAKMLKG